MQILGAERLAAVSPAHAGIDPLLTPRGLAGRGFPRPRGDRPWHSDGNGGGSEFPPPTRG